MVAISTTVALETKQSKKQPRKARKRRFGARSKSPLQGGPSAAKRISGTEIRAKIAANREKRLQIADAMKREAGVTGHEVNSNKEDLSGLALIGTGRIVSPEGRKIVQLYTLAHECGHIFLHNSGRGYWLPSHVKELEAESYAHQALREHGMIPPRKVSDWGRQYVGSWIEKDRAAGIAIDPRAVAYAAGVRSAYLPLRMVPSTWQLFRAESPPVLAIPAPAIVSAAGRSRLGPLVDRMRTRWTRPQPQDFAAESRRVLALATICFLYGMAASSIALKELQRHFPAAFPLMIGEQSSLHFLIALTGGLLLANLAVLWRTATRKV